MKSNNIVALKFGGTSMGSAETMNLCANIIEERIKSGKKPFMVVSAISKMTDTLISLLNLAKTKKKKPMNDTFKAARDRHFEILNNLTKNEELRKIYYKKLEEKFLSLYEILKGISLTSDYSEKMEANVLSYGEDLSSDLMELCLIERKLKGKKIHSKFLVKTHGDYLSATVDFKKSKVAFRKFRPRIIKGEIFVMTGFIGGGKNNEIMLLGRGGSDFSGSIAGVSLESEIVEIWTDANGIMSADPRLIKDAVSWNVMDKNTASEMARAGAKVLHPKTIIASFYGIDIVIKNLFNQSFKGTLIKSEYVNDGVIGVVSDKNYSIVHLENQDMFGTVGFIAEVGLIASENNIPMDMFVTSEISVSFTVKTSSINQNIIKLFSKIANISVVDDVAKISIIGENIAKSSVLDSAFITLKSNKIDPLMVSMGKSQNNIGVIVKVKDMNDALVALHKSLISK